MMTMLKKLCCGLVFSIVLSASCSSKTLDQANSGKGSRIDSQTGTRDDKLYYVDLKSPNLVQPIDAKSEGAQNYKFVQVEVTEVINPKKYPVAFKVYYHASTGEKIYLGSFGLYPSDNPGKFIVATQGKLKNKGTLVLSLVVPENIAAADTLKVAVKKIRLVNS